MEKAMSVVAVLAVMMMVMKGTDAEAFTVGDGNGWKPSSPDFYSSWAAMHTFSVGDTLEFNFAPGTHTVAMLTSEDAFEKCNAALDKNAKVFTLPGNITLTVPGKVFFICTIGLHCQNGQKLAIDVLAAPAAAAPLAMPPSGDLAKESEASVIMSTFSVSFVASSLVMALLY